MLHLGSQICTFWSKGLLSLLSCSMLGLRLSCQAVWQMQPAKFKGHSLVAIITCDHRFESSLSVVLISVFFWASWFRLFGFRLFMPDWPFTGYAPAFLLLALWLIRRQQDLQNMPLPLIEARTGAWCGSAWLESVKLYICKWVSHQSPWIVPVPRDTPSTEGSFHVIT